jgi:predicted PurR-regulated permease PerM
MEKARNFSVHITAGSMITAILFVLLVGVLWYLLDIVLILLTAVVIASAIEPGIHFFMRWRLNRVLAVMLIYVLVAGVLSIVFLLFLPPLLEDAANFLASLPATLSSFSLADATGGLLPNITQSISSAEILRNLSLTLGGAGGGVVNTLSAFFGGLTSFILIVVFSFYFSVQETGVDDFLRLITPAAQQSYVLNLWKRSQAKIGKWMQGQLILMVIVGVLLYLGLTILGVPNALLLAALGGLFELIPVFGPILAAIPAIAISFADSGLTGALLVGGLYLVVQQFESNLIYPVVVKKVVGVPPLLVILALIVGAKLAGFLGILLSVPIAAALQELVADIDRQKSSALASRGDEQ